MQRLVEALFWLLIFLSPATIGGVAAWLLYISGNVWPAGILLIAAVVLGILFAEWARRNYGCSNFIARIYTFK